MLTWIAVAHLHKTLFFSTLHTHTSPLWPSLADAKYKPLGEIARAVMDPVDGWEGSTYVVPDDGAYVKDGREIVTIS